MEYVIDVVKEQQDEMCQLHTEGAASAYACTVLNALTGVFLHSFSQFLFDI